MYRFLEDVAIADVAFEAEAPSFEELLKECGKALMNAMVENLESVRREKVFSFDLEGESEEEILHNFLEELVFLKDAYQMVFSDFKIEGKKVYAFGERIDARRHSLLAEVKAVSWHLFKVERKGKGWRAFVVLDV